MTWYAPDGSEMTDAVWPSAQALGLRLAGDAITETNAHGQPIVDDTLVILLNASEQEVDFRLPDGSGWTVLLDTSRPSVGVDSGQGYPAGGCHALGAGSVCLLAAVPSAPVASAGLVEEESR